MGMGMSFILTRRQVLVDAGFSAFAALLGVTSKLTLRCLTPTRQPRATWCSVKGIRSISNGDQLQDFSE